MEPVRRSVLRQGVRAGMAAAVLSGAPSTLIAVVSGGDPLEASAAAGSILLPRQDRRSRLLVAAVGVHVVTSAFWGVVLAATLPRHRPLAAGSVAGLVIGVTDLFIVGRRYPRIRALPLVPQLLDHIAFGMVVALVLNDRQGAGQPRASSSAVP